MGLGPVYGTTDKDGRGRADYQALGPLDADDIAYLAAQSSTHVLRGVLNTWYGRNGKLVAWDEYQRLVT